MTSRAFILGGLLASSLGLYSLAPSGQGSEASTPEQRLVQNNNRGVALMEQLKFEDAAAQFARVRQLNSRFVPGHVNYGIAQFYLQKYQEAEAAFARAIELDASQIQAHYMLGLIYRNQDRAEEAISAFSKVHQQDPDDAATNYFLGLQHSRLQEYEKAIEYLRRAIAQQPYNASARYNLANALSRLRRREEAVREMNVFRELQGRFGTDTIGLQYLEQGKYAAVIDRLSDYLPAAADNPAAAAVRFREVAADSGIVFVHDGPGQVRSSLNSTADLKKSAAPFTGSALAFGDYDGDGLFDLYLANSGAPGALYRNQGKGSFEKIPNSGIDYSGITMTPLWGDFDNDQDLDLYLINFGANRLYRNDGTRFRDVTGEAGVGDTSWGTSGAFVDYDHDGDLDLFVANFADPQQQVSASTAFPKGLRGADNVIYRNNGDATFTDVSKESGLAGGARRSLGVMATDYNNSRDIDLLVVNHDSPAQLFSNLRDGTFRDEASQIPGSATGLGIADWNQDGLMDFALAGPDGLRVLTNRGHRGWDEKKVASTPQPGGFQTAHFLDYDNDGDLDLLWAGGALFDSAARGANFLLLENRAGEWKDATRQVGLDSYQGLPLRGLSIADFDNDGDLDFAAAVNGSKPLLFRNEGGNRNNWLQVQLVATNSNRFGIGTKVEILAGRHWQKMEAAAGHGFLSQSPPLLHFGLGKRSQVDVVRMLWPGGVLQAELDSPANERLTLGELDRKGTSCPILYVWDGSQYRFQTDFLGGSAYGYLLAPGVYNYPDTDEYVKLDRDALRLKDGRVAVTLNNQLEEVIFFDQLELIAVDHPADYDVFPDEKLLPGPPYADFQLLSVADARPPRSAVDGKGRDLLSALKRIDRVYPELFRELPFKGYADPHELILDLGDSDPDRTVLVMHAWIDYADSTSNRAASQAGFKLIPPYLQVEDRDGEWVTVIERMGFPAGLPKAMTVDLSGRFLSDSRRVRILTNMRIHWDQILVESGPAREDYRVSRLAAERADLHFLGYPAFVSPDGRQPKVYDRTTISARAPWKVHTGAYTRYGDVLPLLEQPDDMYVITRSGDEIEALFDVSSLPELPQGWTRDYLVYVVGFGKDMDINSAGPDTLEPLPFLGMSAFPYPPGESYPDTAAHRAYRKKWNTRIESAWYPSLHSRSRSREAPTPR